MICCPEVDLKWTRVDPDDDTIDHHEQHVLVQLGSSKRTTCSSNCRRSNHSQTTSFLRKSLPQITIHSSRHLMDLNRVCTTTFVSHLNFLCPFFPANFPTVSVCVCMDLSRFSTAFLSVSPDTKLVFEAIQTLTGILLSWSQ